VAFRANVADADSGVCSQSWLAATRSFARPQFNGLGGVREYLALLLPACCTRLDKSAESQEVQFLAISDQEHKVRLLK
jgi:hypothetical protein